MGVTIQPESPDTRDASLLIEELESELEPLYPRESRHGYSVDKLIRQGVAFFVIRVNGAPAGCGGVQLFGSEYCELKRMYVRAEHRGHGLARSLLAHLEGYAQERGIPVLRLETGIYQDAAIALYERCGYQRIGPFDPYWDDPLSLFYEKQIG